MITDVSILSEGGVTVVVDADLMMSVELNPDQPTLSVAITDAPLFDLDLNPDQPTVLVDFMEGPILELELLGGIQGDQGEPGLQGIQGIQGIQGVPGPAGSGSIKFDQLAAAGTWSITHGLGRIPITQIFLATGEQVFPDVSSTTASITVVFATPTAGYVLAI